MLQNPCYLSSHIIEMSCMFSDVKDYKKLQYFYSGDQLIPYLMSFLPNETLASAAHPDRDHDGCYDYGLPAAHETRPL